MNRRRTLLTACGAAALHAPLASFAQPTPTPAGAPGKIWRVGFLSLPTRPANLDTHYLGAFAQGMRELGYVEGKNLLIEWRFADTAPQRLPALAAELVQWKPDVLVTAATSGAVALQKTGTTIPIVMTTTVDPVGLGLVKSLARPGANITGVSNLNAELGPKRLEMLLAMTATASPRVSRVAVLFSPAEPSGVTALAGIEAAATTLGVKILPVPAYTVQEIDQAFTQMRQLQAGALLLVLNPFFQQQRGQISELAAKHRLPTMTPDRLYPEAGLLMSYGADLAGFIRRMAYYVDRIFKGAKPADLPVEQPTRFELVINGKTAKALGLKIPQALLISAERVIE